VPFIRELTLASLAPIPSFRSGCTLYLISFRGGEAAAKRNKDAASSPHAKFLAENQTFALYEKFKKKH
jgi:hypothetical protein